MTPTTTETPSGLSLTYTCKVCRKTLMLQGPPIIGEKAEERLGRTALMMAEHLGKEHQELMNKLFATANQIGGWLITSQFKHSDAALKSQSEGMRIGIRNITKRVAVLDELIEQQTQNALTDEYLLEHSPEEVRGLVSYLMRTMRDEIDEVGKQPSPPA